MATTKVPQTVSTVSPTEEKATLELASKLGVTLHNFPKNNVPTVAQVEHAAKYGQDLYYNDKTRMSWQAARKTSRSGVNIENARKGPFSASQLADGLEALLGWTPNNAQRGSAWNCIDIDSVEANGATITFTLSNGQKYQVAFSEVKPTKSSDKARQLLPAE